MIFLRSTLLALLLLSFAGCGGEDSKGSSDDNGTDETGEETDATDESNDDSKPVKDAGKTPLKDSSVSTGGGKDAGDVTPPKDSGVGANKDAGGSQTTTDAGKDGVDAGSKDAGGGFMFPDLFPTNDAGSTPTTDAGGMGKPGDKSGPCKDLQLLCFDIFDMWIINPEACATCNGGKGCMGCAIPFAF